MNDFKPITEWTLAELIEAAHERGTGFDPIFDEMLRRLEEQTPADAERHRCALIVFDFMVAHKSVPPEDADRLIRAIKNEPN